MSNLGLYQVMTTWAKKVGGPLNLLGVVAVGGYSVIRTAEAGVKMAVRAAHRHPKSSENVAEEVFLVHSDGVSNEGVSFLPGDKIRILNVMDDAVLIEKIGDKDSPYVVSATLLHSISDY